MNHHHRLRILLLGSTALVAVALSTTGCSSGKKLPVAEYECEEGWLRDDGGDWNRAHYRGEREARKGRKGRLARGEGRRRSNEPKAAEQEGPRSESTGEAAPTLATNKQARKAIAEARTYIGTRYAFGGTTRKGIDCSALMKNAWAAAGLTIPRTSRQQSQFGKPTKRKRLQPGDMLFFATGRKGRVSHAGLVVAVRGGEVRFIHASSSSGVREDVLSNSYWAPRFLFARRYVD